MGYFIQCVVKPPALVVGNVKIDDSLIGEEFVIEDYTAPGEDLLSDGE